MTPLCPASAVEDGGAKGLHCNNLHLVVLRDGNAFYAFENRCPHLGLPLEWLPDQFLDEDGDLIRCSTHGALFIKETGECVAGPCSGDRLRAIAIKVVDGNLYLDE